ncbi:MAG: hypothetical protein L3K08_05460, partial [Thermoplasmata archaeon]|nr:hypothetical protein [Thermoplasmata archaeon]
MDHVNRASRSADALVGTVILGRGSAPVHIDAGEGHGAAQTAIGPSGLFGLPHGVPRGPPWWAC